MNSLLSKPYIGTASPEVAHREIEDAKNDHWEKSTYGRVDRRFSWTYSEFPETKFTDEYWAKIAELRGDSDKVYYDCCGKMHIRK
jgi:hypothetical protein